MTYTPEAFRKFCYEGAKQFLQTVVVIDDAAELSGKSDATVKSQLRKEGTQSKVKEPPKGTLSELKTESQSVNKSMTAKEVEGREHIKDDQQSPDQEPPSDPHILEAKTLIDGFAEFGIICSVMRPDTDETKIIDRAVKVASAADIVVVDWMLGKHKGDESESSKAKEIIKRIIQGDLEKRGRLRLIAVYTAEDNPAIVLDELFLHIKDLEFPNEEIQKKDRDLSLENSNLKIVVLNKPSVGAQLGTHPVQFQDLPDELLNLFCDLNMGLLPTVAVRSIAAIREETHHLLAVLHGKLDPALVGHRCLLPHPSDAEEFCEDLISGELRSIIALKKIGAAYADEAANKKWVGNKISQTTPHKYKSFLLTREQAFSLIENGQKSHDRVLNEVRVDRLKQKLKENRKLKDCDGKSITINEATELIFKEGGAAAKHFGVEDLSEKMVPQILHGNEKEGEQVNLEFSRLCSLKREAFGLRRPSKDWVPRLTLGTILQLKENEKDTFLLCLQPRCDSVRFKKDEKCKFPFLILEKPNGKVNVIVKAFDKDNKPLDKKLFCEPKPRNQVVYEFKSLSGDSIESADDSGIYKFKEDVGGKEFFWIADMKDILAQKIADDLSTRVGSVGLDEYEWLRRKAR